MMGDSEVANSWKDMFYEALSSMKALEKEIVHKDGEIQFLKSRIRVSIQDEEERNIERRQQGVLNAAFEGLITEVEAVLAATEAFEAEATHSMQLLTTDVRRYQAASDQKLESLRHKVQEMEGSQNVQNGVLKTIAEEQEILRFICITRAAMQQSTAASLQHLAKLEQFCGNTIQKVLSLVDSGRTKTLCDSQQVPEKMVLLEAMATKHKKELSQAERNLLESLASQTSLRALPNLEHGLPDCNQVRLTTPVKRHSVAGVEVEETSTSARTSSTKGIHKQPNMNQTLMKQSQHEHAKRKLETLKQQDLRDVVARRSSLGFPTHQERTKGHS